MWFLSGLVRRLLGGWLSKVPVLKERGFQYFLCFLIYAPTIYFHTYHTWLYDHLGKVIFTLLATFSVIYAETKGHFPSHLCGTESSKYIKEQLEKGRKISFQKLVDWFGKIRGYKAFDREWCFWHLILCKTVWTIFPALFIGYRFIFVGLCVAFVYPALFWCQLKPFKKIMTSPTNWGEFFQGAIYFQGLL